MTSPSLSLGARPQLSASPRLQQAVRLLQMSTLEFEAELREAAGSNPFLENEDTAADSPPEPMLRTAPEVADYALAPRTRPLPDDGDELNDWAASSGGLREHLRTQVCGRGLDARLRLAVLALIDSIEDDGYLRCPLEDIQAALQHSGTAHALDIDGLQRGLQILQGFDPAGVGARNLQECLRLQLRALPAGTAWRELALALVEDCLPLLARREVAAIRRRLHCSDSELDAAHALLRTLHPHPGERHAEAPPGYVTPDVIVAESRGRLRSYINPAVLPRTRLNRHYVDLLRRSRDSHVAMRRQLQEARWLLRNARQRFVTIQRVADAILERQRAFFSYGEIALRPLMLREVAESLELHESTVSRATGNKYMATPRGVFEFRHFFSRQLATAAGGTCSASAVKAMIQELLEAEDPEHPLSDVELAARLRGHNVRVARRTVAKYRNQLRLPPVELRRRAV